jgi:UDP-N-acetyl-D-galactosamine dehydrogenase
MKIAIVGAGYVGLPLAIAFAKYYPVTCYDINENRIKELRKGKDSNKQHFKKEILQKKIIFTNDSGLLCNKDIFIITVPTPIDLSNQPDLRMLEEASILVGKSIKKNSIIIYESTTFPGCTVEVCIPLIEKNSRLKYEKDFFVAYSPERVNPGDKVNTLNSITKIVGANDIKTLTRVKKLYKTICKSIYTVNSIEIAESAKVIENVQRDINIALINELSVLFNKLKIPTNEVLKAAATKWNFHYYKPGLVGGHCIGIDPYYLSYKANQHNYNPQLILSGRRFNENMGRYVANQTAFLLSQQSILLNKATIAILGFSFKENIPDIRNTKVIQIIEQLNKWNIKIQVFDSIVSKEEVKKKYGINIKSFKFMKNQKFDAIIFAVSHKEFIKKLSFYNVYFKNKNKKIIIDIKNNFNEDNLRKNKYHFFQL